MTLQKATLQEISPTPAARPDKVGSPISVQVNPASLKLALVNNTDVGKAVGRPNTTSQGSSSSTLTFDLVMDTADQGTQDEPVDVQTLTAQLEYFLLPKSGEPKATPPRVLFTFGSLQVAGVMSGLNLDYDLFSESGVPLRAKAQVTIKEQMPQFDADLLGAGANTGQAATDNVVNPTGGSSTPASPPDSTGTALAGESAADFATRMGLDPSTWKSFSTNISDPLHLDAGQQIDFSSSATSSAGLGVTVGPTASTSPSGAGNVVGATAGPVDTMSATAITAAGGVNSAIAQQAVNQSASAAAATRAAFSSSAAPSPPPADARATTYGFGVPLRPQVTIPGSAPVAIVREIPRQSPPPTSASANATSSGGNGNGSGCGCGTGCGCGCGGGAPCR